MNGTANVHTTVKITHTNAVAMLDEAPPVAGCTEADGITPLLILILAEAPALALPEGAYPPLTTVEFELWTTTSRT